MLQKKEKISIAVVDDHPVVIEGLYKILAPCFNIYEVTAFSSGESFLTFLENEKTTVDVVLLDITLPGKSGIELCRVIKNSVPQIIILAFSNHAERSIIMQMLVNGASGYLLKNILSAELLACLNEALDGKVTFSREVKEIMAHPVIDELKKLPPLTKREKEILRMIADGKTSAQIADELYVSPLTVETHRRNLMQKFGVKNAATLIKFAVQRHLI